MSDEELLAAFESCLLPQQQWTHQAHIRVAWIYCSRTHLEDATNCIRKSIRAYNAATKTPEAIDRGYHETITRAFMALVFAANLKTGPHSSSVSFCQTHPELMSKRVLLNYYTRDRIMSWEAKQGFVEPDLAALPEILPPEEV